MAKLRANAEGGHGYVHLASVSDPRAHHSLASLVSYPSRATCAGVCAYLSPVPCTLYLYVWALQVGRATGISAMSAYEMKSMGGGEHEGKGASVFATTHAREGEGKVALAYAHNSQTGVRVRT